MMKRKLSMVLSIVMSLILSVSLLAGCGESQNPIVPSRIVGVWDNTGEEMSMFIYEDGTATLTNAETVGEYTCEYNYDTDELILTSVLTGESMKGEYDDSFDSIDFDEIFAWFSKVDEASFVPEGYESDAGDTGSDASADDSGASSEDGAQSADIENTMWVEETTEMNYHFFEDGIFILQDYDTYDDVYIGEYSWDGSYGVITLGDTVTEIYFEEDILWVVGGDGYDYGMYTAGPADRSLLDNFYYPYLDDDGNFTLDWDEFAGGSDGSDDYEDDDSSGEDSYILQGWYDHENGGSSLMFQTDGIFLLSNDYGMTEGTYTLYDDGTLELIFDDGDTIFYCTYEFDSDAFELVDGEGYYYHQ